VLQEGLSRLFPDTTGATPSTGPASPSDEGPDRQRLSAAAAVLRPLTVVAGGPGTGKTTTVARILALLDEQAEAAGTPPPLVALTAPTGKAAARLEEAVHEEAARLDVDDSRRRRLLATHASTLHRLLGWQPGNRSRFRHNRSNRLPHDVVVVDETSMVSLSQMARLVEAVRPDARLVLVGDPQQLASVEAGAVLGDIVGPAADGLLMRAQARADLGAATGAAVDAGEPPGGTAIGDGIVVLRRVHRFGGGIAAVADAVRRGDADATIAALSAGHDDVTWIPVDLADPMAARARPDPIPTGGPGADPSGDAGHEPGAGRAATLAAVREAAVAAGTAISEAAAAGDARAALEALGGFRLLCAHRRGPYGARDWNDRVQGWLAAELGDLDVEERDYVGRPLLVTENDYELGLYNGDGGVVVRGEGGRPSAAFERGGELLGFSPLRLGAVETVYAMTIHKSQGSQFDTAVVLLPPPESRLLTRELLYTAVTRARRELILIGTEEAVRAAVARPVARASGLGERLWGGAR